MPARNSAMTPYISEGRVGLIPDTRSDQQVGTYRAKTVGLTLIANPAIASSDNFSCGPSVILIGNDRECSDVLEKAERLPGGQALRQAFLCEET